MLALPAVAGKFGVARRRLYDVEFGRLGRRRRLAGGLRTPPATRVVNMNRLGQVVGR